jgi:hypothetical protein
VIPARLVARLAVECWSVMPHEDTNHDLRFRWFVATLGAGLLLLLVTRVYYAFVFLPSHHGSFREAAGRLGDFDGWIDFVRSGPGLALHAAAVACLIAAAVLLMSRRRRHAA